MGFGSISFPSESDLQMSSRETKKSSSIAAINIWVVLYIRVPFRVLFTRMHCGPKLMNGSLN